MHDELEKTIFEILHKLDKQNVSEVYTDLFGLIKDIEKSKLGIDILQKIHYKQDE